MKSTTLAKLRTVALEAESGSFDRPDLKDVLTGFSGEKLMHCLQAFTRILCGPDACYVEIGVFQGLTLLSNAAVNSTVQCFGIDNFSLFNEGKNNLSIVEQRMRKLALGNVEILNMDYETALQSLDRYLGGRKVGVFFVDGPHDYRSQLVPLLLAKPHLAANCAIFVDDANYAHVRQANTDFLRSHSEYALLIEAYTPGHIANLQGEQKAAALAGWWNGVNVMVRDPDGLIERRYPREEMKDLYFQSHDVFRHEFAELAYPALQAVQSIVDEGAAGNGALGDLKSRLIEHRRKHPTRFKHQNTYSDGLPSFAIHG
jgi:hypothetical protein